MEVVQNAMLAIEPTRNGWHDEAAPTPYTDAGSFAKSLQDEAP